MIIVENVLPNARELRPCTSAWKAMTRLAWVQLLALFATFLVSFLSAAIYATETAAIWVAGTTAAAISVLIVSGWFVTFASARIVARAATTHGAGRWTFDQEGVRVESQLSATAFKWEMVEKVSEERDRLVFALSPTSNAILPLRSLAGEQVQELRSLIAGIEAEGRLGRGVD